MQVVGISLLSTLSLLSDDLLQQPLTGMVLLLLLFKCLSVGLTWQLNRAIIARIRGLFLYRQRPYQRIVSTFLACVLGTTLFAWFFEAFRYLLTHGSFADFSPDRGKFSLSLGSIVIRMSPLGLDFFHGLFIAIFYITIYELLFNSQASSLYQEQVAQLEQEKEKLRVANLQSQLDVLKQQVNPHFLFNSLNTLSSLISEDAHQAEIFVDKLSGVYRYVLRSNEQQLISLDQELQFIDAYYHLLQTRYGTGLTLTVAVDKNCRSSQLPPLTLQLLVENAVKHNVVSPKRPLSIHIAVDEQGQLLVQNTLQRKSVPVLSNGIGLTNILAKYQMLNLSPPIVEESVDEFRVRLPLLASPC